MTSQGRDGVLLYYKYLPLSDKEEAVANWYETLCAQNHQRGRIRVAADGINVCVGGGMHGLHEHITAVSEKFGSDIDFKLAESTGARNEVTQQETGFHQLSVKICKELVTLGPLAQGKADPLTHTAVHLSPQQFHQMIAAAAGHGEGRDAFLGRTQHQHQHQQQEQEQAQEQEQEQAEEEVGNLASSCHSSVAAGSCPGTNSSMLPCSSPCSMAPAPHCSMCDGRGTCERCSSESSDGQRPLADSAEGRSNPGSKETVMVDVRNIYETKIGHFQADGIRMLDPSTRCFSDFPAWVEDHLEELRGRRVLMYCTGGVRCERASAYLREKGPDFSDVYQLQGGIQRYLESFPDGGFFKGKNFVYDDRIAVGAASDGPAVTVAGTSTSKTIDYDLAGGAEGCREATGSCTPEGHSVGQDAPGTTSTSTNTSTNTSNSTSTSNTVVGHCLLCSCPWDDYGGRMRCSYCRLLLLVCTSCQLNLQQQQQQHRQQQQQQQQQQLLCDLCQARKIPSTLSAPASTPTADSITIPSSGCRKLRILCLHGFRQTGKQFEGRTHALRRKLKDLADFVFVDAPHSLPFFIKTQAEDALVADSVKGHSSPPVQTSNRSIGEVASPTGLGHQHRHRHQHQQHPHSTGTAASKMPALKRAWLVSPELLQHHHQQQQQQQTAAGDGGTGQDALPGSHSATTWQVAPDYVDSEQYLSQTEGWEESWQVLHGVLAEQGPFDGVLGFSQGAGIAAVLCALQQQQQQQQQEEEGEGEGEGSSHELHQQADSRSRQGLLRFKFSILASGFPSPCPTHQELYKQVGPIQLPSLHLFGTTDRQVGGSLSEELMELFSPAGGLRQCVRHGQAHIIPASDQHVAALRSFLARFL